uniref:putative inorganic carbon transporter subunit DabA n=1 Tax=Porphyrobacter sp. CCH7-A1 TaxID=1768773 RepID=UPI000A5CBE0F
MTQDSLTKPKPTAADIALIADAAARAIPPVWPLASSVAVNPYLGQAGLDLATTAALLARVSDAPATMARSWYRERIGNGSITDGDLAAALAACTASPCPASVAELKLAAQRPHVRKDSLPT